MKRAAGGSGAPSVIDRAGLGRVAVALVALVGALGVAGYCVQANAPRSYADLKADPAFSLRMPGADELGEVGGDATIGIEGGSSAFAGHIFGTTATANDVYAFYDRELAALGWRIDTPPYTKSTVELVNKEYCRAGTSFRLAVKDKDRAFQPSFYKGRSYLTVFDATLLARSPGQPCPAPPLVPTTPIP